MSDLKPPRPQYFEPSHAPLAAGSSCDSQVSYEGPQPLGKRGNSFTLGSERGDRASQNKRKQQGRRDLIADQRRAASIYWYHANALTKAWEAGQVDEEAINRLPGRGVTMCGWTQILNTDTDLMRQPGPDGHRAYLTGLQMCGLRWVCPICTARRAMQDRQTVNDGLAAARSRGLYPVMVTLTTRHHVGEAAEDVLRGIMQAEQKLKRLKVWNRLKGVSVGYVRVLEWTYGEHGHHPHFHTIILVRADSEGDAIAQAETLRGAYMRQLEEAGRDGKSPAAWEHSFHVQGASAAEGYITKWGAAEELTGSLAKDGGRDSLTPWQLLRLSRTAPAGGGRTADQEQARYAAIWWQIITATKGKAQLYKSEGWKNLVAQWRAEQPEPEPAPEPELVRALGQRQRHEIGSSEWMEARDRTIVLREAAEISDLAAARRAVSIALASGTTDADIISAMRDHDPGQLVESDVGVPAQLSVEDLAAMADEMDEDANPQAQGAQRSQSSEVRQRARGAVSAQARVCEAEGPRQGEGGDFGVVRSAGAPKSPYEQRDFFSASEYSETRR